MEPMTYVMSPRGILKIAQVIFVVISLGMWFSLINYWSDFVTGTVFLGFFTSLALFAQNALTGPSRVLEILLSGVLCLFFFISCILVLVHFHTLPVGNACGSFCLFASVVYGLDVFFTFKEESE
ncbi:hypothetical protein OTU49_016352 [Cherax quadricarinatus]|uniref:MARVEL domain-containing protein n=1 Tax=Cherax quadricarinatus TaxID=27406 RepID=A0AAW0YRI6_CHEQU